MPDLTTLLQGNNLVYIILAVLAYFVLMGKKDPVVPPTPTPVDPNTPPVPAPVTPVERPLIDLLIKIVPVLLPILLKQQAEEKAAAAKEEAAK